ncbi:MAG: peptide deformylase [Candidatus Adlerbacteria bacterium]|nr:peptide deformylase [Candidatus Adlerbacteria bacterium]
MKDPIVQAGAKVLSQKAAPVLKKDIGGKALDALIKKMKKALAAEEFGVAIAAPQVGESLRMFVVGEKAFKKDTDEDEEVEPNVDEKSVAKHTVFINPVLTRLSRKKKEMSEGCLSVRGTYGTVLRHEKATVEAWDEQGKPFVYHGSGLVAHIFQHECDHLDGILYIDKALHVEEDEDMDMKSARKKVKDKHGI